jgi:hypothetical protein
MSIDIPVEQDAAAARGLPPTTNKRRATAPLATGSVHQRYGDRASGDDGGLPNYVRYAHLEAAGIVTSWTALNRLIAHDGFPPGVLLSRNVRAWRVDDVQRWLDARPTARKQIPETARRPRRKDVICP